MAQTTSVFWKDIKDKAYFALPGDATILFTEKDFLALPTQGGKGKVYRSAMNKGSLRVFLKSRWYLARVIPKYGKESKMSVKTVVEGSETLPSALTTLLRS